MSSVRPADDAEFDSEVPLLIVGAGAAGLCAALAASEAGVDPVVIERDAVPAGSTALSAGLIPAAGTRFQARAGHRGFARTIRRGYFARKTHGEADAKLVRAAANGAGPLIEWLADAYALPFEVITDFNYPGHSAHRMHGLPSRTGAELIDRLRAAVEARDIPILTGRVCETLFADEDGFIEGVEISGRRDHRLRRAGARLQRLWRQCRARAAAHPRDGRRLVLRASRQSGRRRSVGRGARRAACIALRLSGAWLGRDAAQHPDHLGGDHRGRLSGQRAGPPLSQRVARLFGSGGEVLRQPGGIAFDIFDARIAGVARQFEDFKTAEKAGAVVTADTHRGAGGAHRRSGGRAAGRVRRDRAWASRIASAACSRSSSPRRICAIKVTGALFHTQGGLAIDTQARVLPANGRPFPNLFAAGGAAAGVSGSQASGYLSGNGLLTATVFGRIAGAIGREAVSRISGGCAAWPARHILRNGGSP